VKKKKSAKPKAQKLATHIRFKFADGSYEDLPLADYEDSLNRQANRAAISDHPVLQEIGETQLKRTAERLAKQRGSALQPKVAAKAPRPTRRNPLLPKITEAMRKARRRGERFDDYLGAWKTDEQDRLILESNRDGRYLVTDDNTGYKCKYALTTLEKIWNNARP
jgi:hypothetical protein